MVKYTEQCMGCGGCEIVCPVDAVKICMSDDGFWRPVIDSNKCIDCNKCDTICPIDNINTGVADLGFSYKSNNREVLSKSASGGFCYDLTTSLIDRLPVCSVEYDTLKMMPVHKLAGTLDELNLKRNSIYLQSYTVEGFKRVLECGEAVVVGSPCQISFLNNILLKQKRRDKFLLIDFFCHGIPSYKLWEKYTQERKSVFENKPDVVFRAKENGWGSFTIECKSEESKVFFDKAKDDDIFFRVFLENMALNKSCYTCPYHSNNSGADLRVGDFWGDKYKEDRDGVTAILVYTDNGLKALESVRASGELIEEHIDDVLSGQINEDLRIPSCREKLLKELKSDKSLNKINSTLIFRYKLVRKICRMLGKDYV